MATAQPIRNKHEVRALAQYFLERGQPRNHLLVALGIHTALRIGDILSLCWEQVYDFENQRVKPYLTLVEKKTGKTREIALNKAIVCALLLCQSAAKPGRPLLRSRKGGGALGRVQAYRLLRKAAEALAIPARVSCHSLRKTFGYHAWKNGVPAVVVMEIFNHSSFAVTRRYLGVTQDDKDEAYHALAEVV